MTYTELSRFFSSAANLPAPLQQTRNRMFQGGDFRQAAVLLAVVQHEAQWQILLTRRFHPWEGGEGRTLAAWDAAREVLGLPLADPPANLGETRPRFVPPVARHASGVTDYFATSLPELLLFTRGETGGR